MTKNDESIYRPGWKWLGRSLVNYKDIHAGTAQSKGVLDKLRACTTLTQARKIVFGYKKRNTK